MSVMDVAALVIRYLLEERRQLLRERRRLLVRAFLAEYVERYRRFV